MVFDFELQDKYSIILTQKSKIITKVEEVLNKGGRDGFSLSTVLCYQIFGFYERCKDTLFTI